MIFNWESIWARLKNDYSGLLTEYDVQRDSILELCFHVARRVAIIEDDVDYLTPEKLDETIKQAADEYLSEHDFTPEFKELINQYFIDNPLSTEIENAVNEYFKNSQDFKNEIDTAVNEYFEAHPQQGVSEEKVKEIISSELPNYFNDFTSKFVIEKTQEDVVGDKDFTTEYNNGTRFIVTNSDFLYYLRKENTNVKAVLLSAVSSVNGQTGEVTLDAADVSAASLEDLQGVETKASNNEASITQINQEIETIKQDIKNIPTGGKVESVNGETGAVELDAEKVNAAYIDSITEEAGPIPGLNADTLENQTANEIIEKAQENAKKLEGKTVNDIIEQAKSEITTDEFEDITSRMEWAVPIDETKTRIWFDSKSGCIKGYITLNSNPANASKIGDLPEDIKTTDSTYAAIGLSKTNSSNPSTAAYGLLSLYNRALYGFTFANVSLNYSFYSIFGYLVGRDLNA